jgi:D-aminoacyl-tRNA deacylase
MRIIIQRVKSSQVIVDGNIISNIARGLNLLVGIAHNDTEAEIDWMVRKCLELRLFPSAEGGDKWEKSVQEINAEILVVSQFTLYGDCRKGRRPSFSNSASGEKAETSQNYVKVI